MKSAEIRQKFLDFFEGKNHKVVSSAPIVQKNDPTLMFTNAGMNQFKDIFLGNRDSEARRVADTQKCLRVSGKHNDLEEVGFDTYHHTMFEMLGNWSFGDYFKKEAINWAFELLTKEYKLPEKDLYATVFEGDESEGLAPDSEALDHWKKLLPEQQILMGNKRDNFWEMGDAGPCGPSSEIHIDVRTEEEKRKVPGRELVNQGHPQVIEIWNLVFIQFNRRTDGKLENLPEKHVDTGMGFERLCMVMQGKTSSYDSDVFTPLIRHLEQRFGKKYGADKMVDVAMRVVADHIRAISFTIADGQLPSNTGAGYVIRRILRRAVRYGYRYLGAEEPFLFELCEVLASQFSDVFPELAKQKDFIEKVIKEEEQSFLKTLAVGTKLFNQYVEKRHEKMIEGVFAFELYDTFGFPIDLTRLMAIEAGKDVDEKGFEAKLEEQKSRSRTASAKEETDWVVLNDQRSNEFVGYDVLAAPVSILRYRKLRQKNKEFYQLVLDQTPFYPEGGGQVGDTGVISSNGYSLPIRNTYRENELIVHEVDQLPENPEQKFTAIVDEPKRLDTAGHHSATHLLHQALRSILGTHVQQRGSLVTHNYLRFDFSHFNKVTNEELRQVEQFVNEKVRANLPLQEERAVPVEEAKQRGAMALFGEKYGETVRVITFGDSVELCGGIHVGYTGRIGLFRIRSESAVAAGVRRIEAVASRYAEAWMYNKEDELASAYIAMKNPQKLIPALENLQNENKTLQEQLAVLQKEKAGTLREMLEKQVKPLHGNYRIICEKLEGADVDAVKDLVFELKNKLKDTVILLGAGTEGKANLWLAIPDELVKEKSLDAGNIIREIAREIKGGGGGQPVFATAGGKDPEGVDRALAQGREMVGGD
ncbi:MAG: alanine--tRNA ligase [Bacteroidia bacterium]